MSITEDFAELQRQSRDLLEAEQRYNQLQITTRELSGKVLERIRVGETTGSLITDATLVGNHGRLSQKFEDVYRLVQRTSCSFFIFHFFLSHALHIP